MIIRMLKASEMLNLKSLGRIHLQISFQNPNHAPSIQIPLVVI
jgi:hypothetical protein